ncbi:MAG: crosslink repair DNA glycosylase YcaQ family protein, partial [Ilumatobacteraceae bacterium]
EIYTPQPKRIHGYYVLPILWGDSVVGRLDMKADRHGGELLVQASFAEPGVPVGELADDLAPELHAMAGWLGLDDVEVVQRGDLASTLRDAVGHYARR